MDMGCYYQQFTTNTDTNTRTGTGSGQYSGHVPDRNVTENWY